MNNEFIVKDYNELGEERTLSRIPHLEKRAGEVKEILDSLGGLRINESYRKLIANLFLPRLESLTRLMRKEKEPIALYRLQGRLEELESFVNLQKLIDTHENELKNLKVNIDKK